MLCIFWGVKPSLYNVTDILSQLTSFVVQSGHLSISWNIAPLNEYDEVEYMHRGSSSGRNGEQIKHILQEWLLQLKYIMHCMYQILSINQFFTILAVAIKTHYILFDDISRLSK